MADRLKVGCKVEWESSGGTSAGKVEKQLTSTTRIKGHVAKPTAAKPQWLVKSDKSGGVAAHRPETLKRRK